MQPLFCAPVPAHAYVGAYVKRGMMITESLGTWKSTTQNVFWSIFFMLAWVMLNVGISKHQEQTCSREFKYLENVVPWQVPCNVELHLFVKYFLEKIDLHHHKFAIYRTARNTACLKLNCKNLQKDLGDETLQSSMSSFPCSFKDFAGQ